MTFMLILLLVTSCMQQPEGYVINKNIKRVGMVVGIKPDKIEEYKRLHAEGKPLRTETSSHFVSHDASVSL